MLQNKKLIIMVGFLFALGICFLLLFYIFNDKKDNNNFIIKSNVAVGSEFEKYFADFTNSSDKDINISLLSCGSLDIANPTYEIKNSKDTYLDNFKINKDKNEIYTITVYFDRSKISSDIETIYVSPRFSYELDGTTLIYYFPYSTYK